MTVSTEISSNEYTGNGVTTDFDYKFRIFKASNLSVTTSDTDGDNVVTLRLGTDYTVTGVNKSAGGKVILTKPLADKHQISIARVIPIVQETSFRNQGKFLAETHEDAFDYLTMLMQRVWGSLSLFLKRPSVLANWFDAKGYRIANLGNPKRDSDAVDFGTMKDAISSQSKRSLRVDDMDIAALPKSSERSGNVLTFDKDGKPIVVAPASGSAVDVLNKLGMESGAGLIGSENGNSVQENLNELGSKSNKLVNTSSSFPPDFTRKTIYKTLPLFSQNWQEIRDTWNYSYLYAQGLVFDEVTDEMLILHSAVYDSGIGSNTNLKIFIDIYDSKRNYVQTVCAGFGFPEGAVIGYVNGERRILLASNGSNEKLAVHSFPSTSTLTKFQELPKLFDSVQKFSTQMSACGKYTLLLDPALSTARRGPIHAAYSLHLTNELLTDGNASSLRKSVIYLPAYCTNLGDPSITPKLQSVCLTPNGIIGIGGSQWYASQYGKDADNSLNLQYSTYTSNGGLMSNTVIGYDQLRDIFIENGLPVSFFEPESICYYRGAYYSLLAHANTLADPVNYPNGALTIFIDGIENKDIGHTMHLDHSATKGAFSQGYSAKSCIPYPMNSRTGSVIASANEAVKYMIDNMIDEFKSTIGIFGQTFKVETNNGDVIYSNGGDVEITTANWLWFNLEIKNVNSGIAIGASSVKYRISASGNDQSSWKWSASPIITGGTNSIVAIPEGMGDNVKQVSASGSVSTRYVTRNGVVAENYYSIAAGGVVGGITINANSTTFSTTSDVTWKNEHGIKEYLPDIIAEAVFNGAAQYAAFKANPESIYPMCMAQNLFKFFPEAVHVGDSSPDNPWMVDASKLVPSLMIAIAQLSEKIKYLESK